MRLVLFLNNSALWLTDVTRDSNGRVERGYVENGAWWLVLKDGEGQAKNGREIVTRWPVTSYQEVVDVRADDYNTVICAAEKVRDHSVKVHLPGL